LKIIKLSGLGVTIRRSPSRPGSPVSGGQAGREPGSAARSRAREHARDIGSREDAKPRSSDE